jgi:periplasmic protein TonB
MRSTASQTPFDFAQVAAQRVVGQPVAARLRRDDGTFRLALGVALLAHALLFLSFLSAPTRQLGDPSGIDGAVSIELATEADLRAAGTVSDSSGDPMRPSAEPEAAEPEQASPPQAEVPPLFAPPVEQPPPPQEKAAEATPQPQSVPFPLPEFLKQPLAKAQPTPEGRFKPVDPEPPGQHTGEQKKVQAQPQKKAQTPTRQEAKPQESRPAQPKQNPLLTTKLDLTLPPSAFVRQTFTSGNGGAGLERPAGITRSGENDDFAKGVVRALQRTMPQLSDTRGNVTVRITLDARGNLVSTVVTRPSSVAGLDQSVVFATKQSSFPIPPKNHVQADLVFLITYLYK